MFDVIVASLSLLDPFPGAAVAGRAGARLRRSAGAFLAAATRISRRGPFYIIKFRTMTEARDADGRPLPDSAAPHALRPLACALAAWTSCPSSTTSCAAR